MIQVVWGPELKANYEKLFATAQVNGGKIRIVDFIAQNLAHSRPRYDVVAKAANPDMPWWFVACLHNMECAGVFTKHLHNGDPLDAKTIHVPKGRPLTPPPWTWEQSAHDALVNVMHYDKTVDWSLAHILYIFEGYNGYGYRQYHPTVYSPYLWSFTNHYEKGKYVADGKWDANAVSGQIGIAAILKRMFQLGLAT